MNLSMSVLASFRSGHFNDLTRMSFQHDMTIFAQGRALSWVSLRGPGLPTLKIVIKMILLHSAHVFSAHRRKERTKLTLDFKQVAEEEG